MNILITEEQYNILFTPQVEIHLIEGEEAQKFWDLTYEDEINSYLNEQNEDLTPEQQLLIDRNNEIENLPVSKNLKDDMRLNLFNARHLIKELQEYAESKYNCNIDGLDMYCPKKSKKRYSFDVSKHWVARLFRNPIKPINKIKGIELFSEALPVIEDFISKSNMQDNKIKKVILIKSEKPVYNQVLGIEKMALLNRCYEITFITQMEGSYLRNIENATKLTM